jgi:hypothetical protein
MDMVAPEGICARVGDNGEEGAWEPGDNSRRLDGGTLWENLSDDAELEEEECEFTEGQEEYTLEVDPFAVMMGKARRSGAAVFDCVHFQYQRGPT